MKKSLVLILTFILFFGYSDANFVIDTKLSIEKQAEIMENVEKQFKKMTDEFIKTDYYKRELDIYRLTSGAQKYMTNMLDIIESLSIKNITAREKYILEYLRYIIKNDIYLMLRANYFDATYSFSVIEDIDEIKRYYDVNDELFINILDLEFASYHIKMNDRYNYDYNDGIITGDAGIMELDKYKDIYDNYGYYLGVYTMSMYRQYIKIGDIEEAKKYYDLYIENKNNKLNREYILEEWYRLYGDYMGLTIDGIINGY